MSRLMSVSLTEEAVRERRKTVTRRKGWTFLKPGDRLTLCRKVMGRKRTDGTVEPLVRLAEVEVVNVRREPLNLIDAADVAAEGFPGWTPEQFIAFFCDHMRGKPAELVTRIEWRYQDDDPCPIGDPDCYYGEGYCHDACEPPSAEVPDVD